MISVLEVLENALYNLTNGVLPIQKEMGISQLRNAINQLDKNADANSVFKGDTDD